LQKWDAALRDRLAAATARWSSSERSERIETTRATFTTALTGLLTEADITLTPAQLKTLVSELGEPDDEGELVTSAGKPVADASRRDTENVPWDEDIRDYLEREVKPFVPDAWIDESKTKEGAEIPFTRHFYEYIRPLAEIDRDLDEVLGRIRARLEQVKA
jgi:type I restriction enzyme M protein